MVINLRIYLHSLLGMLYYKYGNTNQNNTVGSVQYAACVLNTMLGDRTMVWWIFEIITFKTVVSLTVYGIAYLLEKL